jgi:hypothetical protein
MKARPALFSILAALALLPSSADAAIGYSTTTFQPGVNWFGDPLQDTNAFLSHLIPTAPAGTTVSLLNGPTATFTGGAWSTDFAINPGTGAALTTPTQFVNVFVGTVLNFDGTVWVNDTAFLQPPPFSGPNGFYFFSSKAPVLLSDAAFPVFQSIIGRAPQASEQVITLDPLTQVKTISTFNGISWDIDPTLPIGQAAMFEIGPIPEPGTNVLILLGLGILGLALRRQQTPA